MKGLSGFGVFGPQLAPQKAEQARIGSPKARNESKTWQDSGLAAAASCKSSAGGGAASIKHLILMISQMCWNFLIETCAVTGVAILISIVRL